MTAAESITAKSGPQIDQSDCTIRQNECLPYNNRGLSFDMHSQTVKHHGLFKQTAKVYKLFLTGAPSFIIKNEQSFSLMKIVKSYLRSKVSRERLNDCMILAADRDVTVSWQRNYDSTFKEPAAISIELYNIY